MTDTPRTFAQVSAFIDDFEARRLPRDRWTHEGHLVAGLWYVWRLGPARALASLRTRIREHNTAVGTPNTDSSGYHETITRLYVEGIGRLRDSAPEDTFEAALARLLASPMASSKWPLTLYTAEQLFCVQARREWVPPSIAEAEDRASHQHPATVQGPEAGSMTRTYRLAQLNIAIMKEPADSPAMTEFFSNVARINELAEAAPGFVWRLVDDDPESPFGPTALVNLSVWQDVAALSDFVFKSEHLGIMRRRREWFERRAEATMVLWWVPAGHVPTVREAAERLELLRRLGPSANAFSFASPFDPPAATSRMPVSIVTFPQTRVAGIRHVGHPSKEHETARKLVAWKLEHGLLDQARYRSYGLHYTDPRSVPPDEHRVDFCLSCDGVIEPNDHGIVEMTIPSMRCAMARDIGSRLDNKTAKYLHDEWLPGSGEQLAALPLVFHYVNVGPAVQEHEAITDVYLPLR